MLSSNVGFAGYLHRLAVSENLYRLAAGFLNAFDFNRDVICAAAAKVSAAAGTPMIWSQLIFESS
jgi:hypothetical protein